MRAVFCYKPVKNYKGENIHYKPLNDSFFKLARLSVQTISRYYKTYFYTDFDTAKLFRENGLLFDEVIILNKLQDNNIINYALPKIYTMLSQDLPFIMFDFDTVLNEKLVGDCDVTYAYYEADYTTWFNPKSFNYFNESYIKPFNETLSKYYDDWFVNGIDWRRYPNFSAVMINDVMLPKICYGDLLSKVPIHIIESMPATLIEQFLLHQYVLTHGKSYCTFLENPDVDIIEKKSMYHISINHNDFEKIYNRVEKFVSE